VTVADALLNAIGADGEMCAQPSGCRGSSTVLVVETHKMAMQVIACVRALHAIPSATADLRRCVNVDVTLAALLGHM
jgi:hypothetical protein